MARTERELGARDKHTRDGDTYAPPGTLPEPAPEPGWVFRWIATHVMSKPDNSNVSKKMREGWEPVKAVDQPQMEVLPDHPLDRFQITLRIRFIHSRDTINRR